LHTGRTHHVCLVLIHSFVWKFTTQYGTRIWRRGCGQFSRNSLTTGLPSKLLSLCNLKLERTQNMSGLGAKLDQIAVLQSCYKRDKVGDHATPLYVPATQVLKWIIHFRSDQCFDLAAECVITVFATFTS